MIIKVLEIMLVLEIIFILTVLIRWSIKERKGQNGKGRNKKKKDVISKV